MRPLSPASHGSLRLRLSAVDVIWAAIAPCLALACRDPSLFSPAKLDQVALYCGTSFFFALIAFIVFRTRDGIAHHFSVHDALVVAKAVVLAESLSILTLFTVTRLDIIPRSTPIIHGLMLSAGLVLVRTFVRVHSSEDSSMENGSPAVTEHIILIGATRLSYLFTQLIRACSPNVGKIIALLDSNPEMRRRSIAGIPILGTPQQLPSIIDEFAEHGVFANRVVVGGDRIFLEEEALGNIEQICANRGLKLDFVPQLIGVPAGKPSHSGVTARWSPPVEIQLSSYFAWKRVIDLGVALFLLIVLSPVLLIVAVITLVDVGSPVFFWQRRAGLRGRPFLLYKFRTLKTCYDPAGNAIPARERVSAIGHWSRKLRLDELPQLLNVLVGDMSLIGPRPLLPQDQPPGARTRLMVRPGITGWAQVNGGKILTPIEKNRFDEWYLRNASFWFDVKIVLMTIGVMLFGEHIHLRRSQDTPRSERSGRTDARPTQVQSANSRQYP